MKRKNKVVLFSLALMCIVLGFCFYESGLMINITGSMPRGIYFRETGKIQRGDLVTFCLNSKNQQFGLARGYLIHGMRCQFSEPLIKKVIAVPGDDISLSATSIIVNNQTLPYSTLPNDSHGRPLNAYPTGNYLNTKGYWVMGTESKRSWDSRYFGPIPPEAILWKLKPVFVFSRHTKRVAVKQCTLIFDNNITLNAVPLAETLEEQKKGLSGKEDAKHGMFFMFAHPKRLAFWMRDTTQALSIGFFDETGKLINIEDMVTSSTQLYFSAGDAVSALELPQGQFQKKGIKTGTKLLHKYCH